METSDSVSTAADKRCFNHSERQAVRLCQHCQPLLDDHRLFNAYMVVAALIGGVLGAGGAVKFLRDYYSGKE